MQQGAHLRGCGRPPDTKPAAKCCSKACRLCFGSCSRRRTPRRPSLTDSAQVAGLCCLLHHRFRLSIARRPDCPPVRVAARGRTYGQNSRVLCTSIRSAKPQTRGASEALPRNQPGRASSLHLKIVYIPIMPRAGCQAYIPIVKSAVWGLEAGINRYGGCAPAQNAKKKRANPPASPPLSFTTYRFAPTSAKSPAR